ncbi:MAG: hypothetical protein GVY24_01515 [Planctomycetes bacterium]|jgi:hypothetical protein|nr:hypothetical protein [Planctomycetota bacterium]
MPRVLPSLHLVMAIGLAAGCLGLEPKGGQIDEPYRGGVDWPFVPAAMRIHPFTSIEYDDKRQAHVLEARVEMLDRVGDITKAVGTLRFELYQLGERASAGSSQTRLLYSWDAPLRTIEQNRTHFDPITRTYLFKLKLDRAPAPGSRLRVVAQLTDPDERHLTAQAKLDYRGSAS